MPMHAALALLLVVGSAGRVQPSPAESSDDGCIDEDRVVDLFKSIRKGTTWEMNGPMLWGYYFAGQDHASMTKAADALERDGYRFVELIARRSARAPFTLHVEKIETHSVTTLNARNSELCALATRLGLRSYEGADVQPAPTGDGRPTQARRRLTRR
jgi:regulator of ribonuclease activity B